MLSWATDVDLLTALLKVTVSNSFPLDSADQHIQIRGKETSGHGVLVLTESIVFAQWILVDFMHLYLHSDSLSLSV